MYNSVEYDTTNKNHIPPSGLPINLLKKLQENLQEPVSRELHAFCHLCPADSPAALELVTLNKHAKSH